jgi:hypothetical protein
LASINRLFLENISGSTAKTIKHDGREGHKGENPHPQSVVPFVPFVFKDLFAVESSVFICGFRIKCPERIYEMLYLGPSLRGSGLLAKPSWLCYSSAMGNRPKRPIFPGSWRSC